MEIFPTVIICGCDQRNIDGAEATAEGIISVSEKRETPFFRNPGLTYPYYARMDVVAKVHRQYGDNGFLRHICRRHPETAGFWSESVLSFQERLMTAVENLRRYRSEFGLELWDLNYEQMAVLHQSFVIDQPLTDLVTEGPNIYECDYGAGFVIGGEDTIAEFNAKLEIGSSAKPAKKK